eukprot:6491845-Amphidinium_carterae.1
MAEQQTGLPSLDPSIVALQELHAASQLWPVARRRREATPHAANWDLYHAALVAHIDNPEAADMEVSDEASDADEADVESEVEDELLDAMAEFAMAASVDEGDQGQEPPDEDFNAIDLPLPDQVISTTPSVGLSASGTTVEDAVPVPDVVVPPELQTPRVFLGREPALATVAFASKGVLRYHRGRNMFEATCTRHANCTLTRSSSGGRRASGRPLGLLAAWLLLDSVEGDHKTRELLRFQLTLEKRQAGRAHLETLEGHEALCAHERAIAPGEPQEPLTLKGLM